MKLWRSEWGEMRLLIPARLASRRTILVAPKRSTRRPVRLKSNGPSRRPLAAWSTARATRGGSGMRAGLLPLADDVERPVAALETQVLDVDVAGLRDPKPEQT